MKVHGESGEISKSALRFTRGLRHSMTSTSSSAQCIASPMVCLSLPHLRGPTEDEISQIQRAANGGPKVCQCEEPCGVDVRAHFARQGSKAACEMRLW